MSQLNSSLRIRGLDGLRAIAVLLVFLDHRVELVKPFHLGGFGVRMFFVLSGFLIVGILFQERLAIEAGQETTGAALRRFVAKRAVRIMPIYYLVLGSAVGVSCFASIEYFATPEILSYLFFLTNLRVGYTGEWVGAFSHLWSLAVEEQFYLVAAPVLLLTPAAAMRRICIGTAAAAVLWHFRLVLAGHTAIELGMDPLSNFGLFAIGGAAALTVPRAKPSRAGLTQGALLLSCLILPFAVPQAFANPIIRQLGQPLLVALLLVELRDGQSSRTVGLLSAWPLQAFGTISYGFYLYHAFVTVDLVRVASLGQIDLSPLSSLVQAVVLFGLSTAAAALSWRLVERPMIQWLRRSSSPHGPLPRPQSRSLACTPLIRET